MRKNAAGGTRRRHGVSLLGLIENEEVARVERRRGNSLFALLVIHAALEGLLSTVKGGHKRQERFVELVPAYASSLRARGVPETRVRRLTAGLLAFNRLRNTVIHSWLIRYGFQRANRMLRRRRRTGLRLYLLVLNEWSKRIAEELEAGRRAERMARNK